MMNADLIKSRVDIVEVIRRDEPNLKETGQGWRSGHESKHESESGNCLTVYPDTQKWHCYHCGEHGDTIDWVMGSNGSGDFISSCEWLCQEYNIDIPAWTQEQRQQFQTSREKKTHIRLILREAFEFYHFQLADIHRDYLHSRGLTDETIAAQLIGYAPDGGYALRDHFKSSTNHSSKDLLATGLFQQTKSKAYDYYQDRIVLPYWLNDETVYSIGRLPTDDEDEISKRHESDRNKYKKQLIHSEKRPYISKYAIEHTIYGRDSIRGNKSEIIITEGILDAILAIQAGFACLSPATTTFKRSDIDKLELLTRQADTVYIINDNEDNAAGLEGAVSTAKALFLSGRDVRIVKLPNPEEQEKIDLADFLNVPDDEKEVRLDELKNLMIESSDYVDFQIAQITEQEGKKRDAKLTELLEIIISFEPLERSRIVEKIADSKLANKGTIEKQLKVIESQEQPKKQNAYADEKGATKTSAYTPSVFELGNRYVKKVASKTTNEEIDLPISSFVIKPKLRVWIDRKEHLKTDFVTSNEKTYPNVTIHRADWNDTKRFMDTFPSVDLQWRGKLNDVQDVLTIASSYDVPTKEGTTQLGLHKSGIWVLPNGEAFGADGWIKDPDLVYMPLGGNGELDNKIEIPNLSDSDYHVLLQSVYTHLLRVNDPKVIIPTIGWFMATPLKPRFSEVYECFPILSIAGTRGAGKSTLLRLMWRLMGFKVGNEGKLFSCTETDFVMLKLLSSTASIPILFDEYKPYDMPQQKVKSLRRTFRKAYDGEKEFRGRPDQSTVEYSLSAPIAVAGEVPLTEGALLERIIAIEMSPNTLNQEMRDAYQALRALQLQAFMSRYIPFMLGTDFELELAEVETFISELVEREIPDRVRKNLVVMVFGFFQFLEFGRQENVKFDELGLVGKLKEAAIATVNAVCGEDGVTKIALDYMVEHLSTMAEIGRLRKGVHYIAHDKYSEIAIRFNACLSEFRKYHRETQIDGELLNDQAYRRQIKENFDRDGYISSVSERQYFGKDQKRVVILDPKKAEDIGLDIEGFFGKEFDDD